MCGKSTRVLEKWIIFCWKFIQWVLLGFPCDQLIANSMAVNETKLVEALVHLIIQSAKAGVSWLYLNFMTASLWQLKPSDVSELLARLDIESHLLVTWYEDHKSSLRQRFLEEADSHSGIPSYQDVEWRLEAQLASRTLSNQLDSRVIIRLKLSDGTRDIRCTPANLIHLKQVLEEALENSRTVHVQKLLRHLK